MKRVLLGFLVLVLALVLAVAGIVATVWWKPSLLLNEKGAHWALRFAPAGTTATWSSFAWTFAADGFWGKGTNLEIHDLCFTFEVVKGCAPLVKVDASFTIAGFHPRLTRIASLRLDVNDILMKAAAPDAPVAKNAQPLPDLRPPSFAGIIPRDLDLDQIGYVDLQVRQFVLLSADGSELVANIRLHRQESPKGTARFSLIGKAEKEEKLSLSLDGRGEILAHQQKFQWKGTAEGKIDGWRVALPFDGAWSDRIELHGQASAVNGRNHYQSPISLDWRTNRIVLGVSGLSIEDLWPKKRLSFNECRLESVLDHGKGYPKKSELHCDLALVALKRGALLPPLTAKLVAELGLQPARADAFDVDFKLHELGTNDYLNSKIEASASGRFLPRKGEPEGNPKLELAVNLKVPELQAWRKSLDHTPFAIPAPFRTLEGPASLDVTLEKESREAITAKALLASDFHGGRQVFVTNHEAHITLHNPWAGKKSVDVDDRSELTDVALEAPPLKLESPPQFLPDRRFEDTRKKVQAVIPQSSIPIHWKLALATKSPFRIRTNLLESEVPIALDIAFADDADMTGDIKVLEMPLQVFKKKAQVKHVSVSFRDGSKQGEVDGLAIYKNPEVTVQIMLLGSTDKPRVEFQSNPPLTRSQIVSVLLFNKSVSELTDEEAASAGNFSQATADGALGLFSLLFLSSTPVESVSYDPVSQTYAARVRLGDKTTLSVGSDFDHERQVALRRRLGARWAIRTELHDEEGKPDVVLTLLEWFKRF